jgi:hypothetical protein
MDGPSSRWAIVAQEESFFRHDAFADAKQLADQPGFKLWQDDYSSLFAVLM